MGKLFEEALWSLRGTSPKTPGRICKPKEMRGHICLYTGWKELQITCISHKSVNTVISIQTLSECEHKRYFLYPVNVLVLGMVKIKKDLEAH